MTEAGWTSNAPTKEGWYWWRNLLTDNAPEVWAIVDHGDGLEVIGPFDETALDEWVSDMGGEWLGPITPDSYQQGWVACLGDVKRYVERQIKIGEDFIGGPDPNIQRRVALDEVIEYCDRQLAQAQDEKGVGDGKV